MSDRSVSAFINAGASMLCALITTLLAVRGPSKQANLSANKAEKAAAQTQDALLAVPGRVVVSYSGSMKMEIGKTEHFNFAEKHVDAEASVETGTDWRFVPPVDGIYMLSAQYLIDWKPGDNTNPYLSCGISVIHANSTQAEPLNSNCAFSISCEVSGVFLLRKGDRVISTVGQSGIQRDTHGNFSAIIVGSGH